MRPEPFELNIENYPFTTEIQLRFGDVDLNGHVNNVAVVRLFEECRVRFALHYRKHASNAVIAAMRATIVSTLVTYLHEIFYPDPVIVGVGMLHIGTSSFTKGAVILQRNRVVAHCRATLVRSEQGKSQALPEELIAIMRNYPIKTD
jgi:acyl-CoA thioester hydrolase